MAVSQAAEPQPALAIARLALVARMRSPSLAAKLPNESNPPVGRSRPS